MPSGDTLVCNALVCSGCDSLTPAADSFWLWRTGRARIEGTYCRTCAERHQRGEPMPKSRFPRTAAFSLDGKTWTLCDLRDAPA